MQTLAQWKDAVSVRMLRHHDDIGLLTPAHVDSGTGRRSYGAHQLARLNRLVALKELNGHTLSVDNARWREIYLETNDADYSDWLIEVQLELVNTPDG